MSEYTKELAKTYCRLLGIGMCLTIQMLMLNDAQSTIKELKDVEKILDNDSMELSILQEKNKSFDEIAVEIDNVFR